MKKRARRFTREEIASMAAMQNMVAFPPAPKLGIDGKLSPKKATESELRGEKVFTEAWASCHAAPYYTDNSAHDLQVERFYEGRLLTLEDTVEFFNLILETDFNQQQTDFVAFLRTL